MSNLVIEIGGGYCPGTQGQKSRESMHEYYKGDSYCCLPGCTGSSAVFVSLRSRYVFAVCETTVDSQTNTSVWIHIFGDVLLGNLKFTVSLDAAFCFETRMLRNSSLRDQLCPKTKHGRSLKQNVCQTLLHFN